MTLAELALESPGRIRGFSGLEPEQQGRLAALGVREGARVVKLLRAPLRDPIECLVGTHLLALEAWLLERILVEAA